MKPILINTVVRTLVIPDTETNLMAAFDRLVYFGSTRNSQISMMISPSAVIDYLKAKTVFATPYCQEIFSNCLPDGQYCGCYVWDDRRAECIRRACIAAREFYSMAAWGQLVIMESVDGRTQAGVPNGGRSEAEDAGGIREPESVPPGDMEALEVPGDTSGNGDPEQQVEG